LTVYGNVFDVDRPFFDILEITFFVQQRLARDCICYVAL